MVSQIQNLPNYNELSSHSFDDRQTVGATPRIGYSMHTAPATVVGDLEDTYARVGCPPYSAVDPHADLCSEERLQSNVVENMHTRFASMHLVTYNLSLLYQVLHHNFHSPGILKIIMS